MRVGPQEAKASRPVEREEFSARGGSRYWAGTRGLPESTSGW